MNKEDASATAHDSTTSTDDVDKRKTKTSLISEPGVGEASGASRHVMEGARIKHYTIVQLLGQGGTAEVFLARDMKLERMVALKRPFRPNAASVERTLSEARILARLRHENIVVVYEVNGYRGHPFMTLEYIEGKTLRTIARQGKANFRFALEVMIPVVRTLVHIHARGVVHRDLKPENILVENTGRIKIIDFSVAQARSGLDDEYVSQPKRGKFRGPRGTLRYMSPEQVRGDVVDQRSDLWAAGVLLHELAFGAHPLLPLSHDWQPTVMQPDLPNDYGNEDDTGLSKVIARCLRKRRDERMASATELLGALEQIAPDEDSRKIIPPGDGI
jgi:eukaryotic-like serine/threonine-protein kinase